MSEIDGGPQRPGLRAYLRRHSAKLLLSLAIAALFAWILHRGALPVVPPPGALSAVSPWGIAASVGLWVVVYLVRAGRWYWLLAAVERVPVLTVLRVSFVGFAALVLLPLRTGEVVRPLLIHRTGRMSAWAATGTVGAERVIDGLTLSGLLFVALRISPPMDPLPHRIGGLDVPTYLVPRAADAFVALFACAFAIMSAFYWRREWARRVTEALLGKLSSKLARYAADKIQIMSDGLGFLARARYTLPFLAGTAVYWLGNAATYWTIARSTGVPMSYTQAIVVMGVLGLGILVPNAPGFFGVFQLSLYAGLALYFPADSVLGPGASFVFMVYLVHVGLVIVLGAVAALLEPSRIADSLEQPELGIEEPGR